MVHRLQRGASTSLRSARVPRGATRRNQSVLYFVYRSMGKALFAAALSLVLAGLGHLFLGVKRGIWFVIPSAFLLYLHWTGAFALADAVFMALGIFAAFDAYSFARRGHGIF